MVQAPVPDHPALLFSGIAAGRDSLRLCPSPKSPESVTDQTGAAISGAEVTFTAGSFSATQVTNDWGKFTFSNVPVEAGVARASADGFQVNTADWRTGSGPLQIVLLPATAAEQVTVTANRTGVRVVENATSVTILSGPDIERPPRSGWMTCFARCRDSVFSAAPPVAARTQPRKASRCAG